MGKMHDVVITYLEMRANPHLHVPAPRGKLALIRAERPPLHFYRYLYDAVGRDYVWVDRKRMSDEALATLVRDDDVEIYVLYRAGCPAGFVELDFRRMPEAELALLGLMPEAQGRGLGRYLLAQAITLAWAHQPERLQVQTCTLDHPGALSLYQKCGFTAYAQETTTVEDIAR